MKSFLFLTIAMMVMASTVNARQSILDKQVKKLPNPSNELPTINEKIMPLLNAKSAPVQYTLTKVIEVWNLSVNVPGGKTFNATIECLSFDSDEKTPSSSSSSSGTPVTIILNYGYMVTRYGHIYVLNSWHVKQ
ncbi:hypothetical protein TYRP_015153 [Tyrophagus putrescentiae]|nr:hypothetical protein TYRP_015153 [Tyrophagus putrescentiae]